MIVFLVFALFLISSCKPQAKGRFIEDGSAYGDYEYAAESTIISGCRIEFSQSIDFLSDNYNKLPLLSNEDRNSLGAANAIHITSDEVNGIKLSKSDLSIQTDEVWLYYRDSSKPIAPMYYYAIFYVNHDNSNKKSLFTAEPYKEEAVSINC